MARSAPRAAAHGALTPFPLAVAVLMAFAHRQGGPPAAVGWLRACLWTMWSTAGFCFVLSLATVPLGRDTGFLAAFEAAFAGQLGVGAVSAGRGRRTAGWRRG